MKLSSLNLVLLLLLPASCLGLKCYDCGVPAMSSDNPPSSWKGCKDEKPAKKTCDDGVEDCVWFRWKDGDDKEKTFSGCASDL